MLKKEKEKDEIEISASDEFSVIWHLNELIYYSPVIPKGCFLGYMDGAEWEDFWWLSWVVCGQDLGSK